MNKQDTAPDFVFEKSLKPAKPSPFPKIYQLDRYINRPIAALLVRAVVRTSLTPNHLTIAAFIIGSVGAFFYLGGDHRSFVIAGILIYVSTILDGADGMLARSKNLSTRFGAYLDLYLDRVTDFLVFGAMMTGYYYQSGRLGFYILSLIGLAMYMLMTVAYYIEREWKMMQSASGSGGQHRGLVYLAILVFSLLNQMGLLITLLLFVPPLNILYRFIRFWIIERQAEPTVRKS